MPSEMKKPVNFIIWNSLWSSGIGPEARPINDGLSGATYDVHAWYDEFDKLSYQSAFQTILQIDPLSITEQELVEAIASGLRNSVDWRGLGKDDWLDLLLTEFVQPRLGLERPCILYNY